MLNIVSRNVKVVMNYTVLTFTVLLQRTARRVLAQPMNPPIIIIIIVVVSSSSSFFLVLVLGVV